MNVSSRPSLSLDFRGGDPRLSGNSPRSAEFWFTHVGGYISPRGGPLAICLTSFVPGSDAQIWAKHWCWHVREALPKTARPINVPKSSLITRYNFFYCPKKNMCALSYNQGFTPKGFINDRRKVYVNWKSNKSTIVQNYEEKKTNFHRIRIIFFRPLLLQRYLIAFLFTLISDCWQKYLSITQSGKRVISNWNRQFGFWKTIYLQNKAYLLWSQI